VPRQVELRGRLIEAGSTGAPPELKGRGIWADFFWLLFLADQEK